MSKNSKQFGAKVNVLTWLKLNPNYVVSGILIFFILSRHCMYNKNIIVMKISRMQRFGRETYYF